MTSTFNHIVKKIQSWITEHWLLIPLILIIISSSCSFQPEVGSRPVTLTFSQDTLAFDTVFTERLSISRRLWVRNPSSSAVNLSEISLNDANFELRVNGRRGSTFQDEIIYANDSLLILVEASIDANQADNPFIIRSAINFVNNGFQQQVPVEAYGQNAIYIKNDTLECQARWEAGKPYVLMGNILVSQNCELSIEAGTKIYSAPNSFLVIKGTINSIGTSDSLIVFSNDRLDQPFSSSPGQWGGIIILENDNQQTFTYTEIKNSRVGINAIGNNKISPLVNIRNCRIGNISGNAILSLNGRINAENSLFYETLGGSVVHVGGGSASYAYCTIANYFNANREESCLIASDAAQDNNENEIINALDLRVENSIIYGRLQEELTFAGTETGEISLLLTNNILRSQQQALSNENFLNEDPLFAQPFNLQYQLSENSPAINQGSQPFPLTDILGIERDSVADIGAFEFRVEEE